MGRKWSFDSPLDLYAMSEYSSITSLSESPLVEGLLYAGTDDGLIQVSEDGGANWRKIDKLPGVPKMFFVNDIRADLHDANTVYVVVDHHKQGDFSPYVLKSSNRGKSWSSIAANLPERHVVWRLVQDHVKPELIFLGTEFGIFFTVDGGKRWTELQGGSPTISYRDLVIQRRENDLVAASFGRGFFVLDDYSPLRDVTAGMLEKETVLFPVRDAHWYLPRRSLGCYPENCVDQQGAGFYTAPNPPFGAVFTYYLPEEIHTSQGARREREKPLEKLGQDTPFPGWDTVIRESMEDEPTMVLTVRNENGDTVRHIEGPVTAGFHRVAWDLRYPVKTPWVAPEKRLPTNFPPAGVLAAPGNYSVTMDLRVDGRLRGEAVTEPFKVVSIRETTLPGASQDERVLFSNQVDELKRRVDGSVSTIDELIVATGAIKESLTSSTADVSLYAETQALEQRARLMRERLKGNADRALFNNAGAVSVSARLSDAGYGSRTTVYGPTTTQRRSLEIASEEFTEIDQQLQELYSGTLKALLQKLDAAGVPWTPGRGALPAE